MIHGAGSACGWADLMLKDDVTKNELADGALLS